MSKKLPRLQVSLPSAGRVALGLLARKHGMRESSQATLLLMQALSQTINSRECQEELARVAVARTNAQWREDQAIPAEALAARRAEEALGR